MDWQAIIKQQKDIEDSFTALKLVFEQAELDFKNKGGMIMKMMANMQAQDANNLQKIHQGLQAILESNAQMSNTNMSKDAKKP